MADTERRNLEHEPSDADDRTVPLDEPEEPDEPIDEDVRDPAVGEQEADLPPPDPDEPEP